MDVLTDNSMDNDIEEPLVFDNNRLTIDEGETIESENDESLENEASHPSDNESDSSDSDVIFVERNEEEVIELSDEEAHNRKIFQNVDIPPPLLMNLQEASKNIRKVVSNNLKNKVEAREVIAEVSNHVWSLPWECVSALFHNPKVLSQKSAPKKLVKKKKDVKKVVNNNSNVTHIKTPKKIKIKQEKKDGLEDDRNLSVIHFDPNKPPEFCEVSRSGRLIKKPSRLNSIVYGARHHNRQKKKTNVNNESNELSDSDSSGIQGESPEQTERHGINVSNKQNIFKRSMDSESDLIQEQRKLKKSFVEKSVNPKGLNILKATTNTSQSMDSDLNRGSDSDESGSTCVSNLGEICITPTSKRGSYVEESTLVNTKMNLHNHMERKRRNEMRRQFHDLICCVLEVREDLHPGRYSKIAIINESRTTVQLLEAEMKKKEIEIQKLRLKQQSLIKSIQK